MTGRNLVVGRKLGQGAVGAKSLQSIHARITMEIGDARAGGQSGAIGGEFEVIECREMGVCPFRAQFPLAGAPPRSMMSDTAFLHGLRQLTQISLPLAGRRAGRRRKNPRCWTRDP